MPWIDAWLRVRLARVVRDTALAVRLLADLPWPAARAVPGARAQALIAAGDTATALDALAQAGKSLDEARLALVAGGRGPPPPPPFPPLPRPPHPQRRAAPPGGRPPSGAPA